MKKKLIRITTVPVSLYKLLKGQMRFMKEHYELIAVSSNDDLLAKVGEDEGIRVKGIDMTREITLGKDFRALWLLYKFLRKEKPLIVHSHTPKAGIVGMIAAWLARVPLRLHTVAGLPLMETNGCKRRLLNLVERMTCMFAKRIYPNSYKLRDFIVEERLCDPKKLIVIGSGSSNGIDTSFFDPELYRDEEKTAFRKRLQIGKEDFIFIFIGRLVKDKGLNELVSAFTNMNIQNSRLLLVGAYENQLDPLCPGTLTEITSNSRIISVGFQEDVRPYLAVSNALVFPSYREGFPNVVMQAGAMGLPCIVSDINGCNEIIINGENGVIIPPKNEGALLKAMYFFFENRGETQCMASKARPLIIDRYRQKVFWEAMLQEYKRLENEIIVDR